MVDFISSIIKEFLLWDWSIKALWSIKSFSISHPILMLILFSLVIGNLVLVLARLAKRVVFPNWLHIFLSWLPKNRFTMIASVLSLGFVLALTLFRFAQHNPYRLLNENNMCVLVFPIFDISTSGRLKPSESGEIFQIELARKLIPINAISYQTIILKKDSLPYEAYSYATFNKLLERIVEENQSPFYYFYIIKSGNKYEIIQFKISPGGEYEPKGPRARNFCDDASRAITLFANKNKDITTESIAKIVAGIFLPYLAQGTNTLLMNYGCFNKAERNIDEAISLLRTQRAELSTAIAFPKSNEIEELFRDTEAVLLIYKQLIDDDNLYKKAMQLFQSLKKNPYAPFPSEKKYIEWLITREEFYNFSRFIPLINWIQYDSMIEKFIGYLTKVSNYELPFNQICKMLNEILPDKSWLKKYYLCVIACLWHNDEAIEGAIKDFSQENTIDPEVTKKLCDVLDAFHHVNSNNFTDINSRNKGATAPCAAQHYINDRNLFTQLKALQLLQQ